ncbi:MAG: DUF2752 domain-containing protein [Deltaproteobacteria bacterium]|nr:DUF2752 domain-containing protein [Deltaproteobacteria bacterium]
MTSARARAALSLGALGLGVAVLYQGLWARVPPLCLFRRLVGLPCPSCGMTRALAWLLHGDLSRAWALNPAALPLLAVTCLGGLVLLLELLSGRPRLAPWWRRPGNRRGAFWFTMTIMGLTWGTHLYRHVEGRGPLAELSALGSGVGYTFPLEVAFDVNPGAGGPRGGREGGDPRAGAGAGPGRGGAASVHGGFTAPEAL